MGFGGISIWQLLIILVIVVLLFGTKRLKGMGADIGGAVKGFKKALNSDDEKHVSTDGDTKDDERKEEAVAHDNEKK